MTKKRTIFFDIGNVLIYFSHELMFKQIAKTCGLSPLEIARELTHLGTLYEEGKITTDELFDYFATKKKRDFTKTDFIESLTHIFQPNESMVPIVESLIKKEFQLVLLSNICEAHYAYISENYKFIRSFHHPILSYRVQARKPSRAIFEAALNTAQCSPEDCFYTDDIPEYVEAAKSLGIDAEVFIDSTTLIGHLKKRQLDP